MSHTLTLILLLICVLLVVGLAIIILYLKKDAGEPSEGLQFESQQGSIYYKVYGKKGPAVVLVHGLGASTYCWRNIAPELASKYQVICIDLWGFGASSKKMLAPMTLDSQADVIIELMDYLKIKDFHLVGHSMGAEIGLWLKHNNNRVKKCVAITPSAHPSLVSDWLRRFAWIAKLTPLVLTAAAIKRILVRSLKDPGQISEEMIQSYYRPYTDPAAHVSFASALNIISDWRVWDCLDQLDKDVYVIFADHDQVINRRLTKMMIDKFATKNIVVHPWAGHLPMEDDPQWLVEQLFLTLKQ